MRKAVIITRQLALPVGEDHKAWKAVLQVLIPCFIAGEKPLPKPLLPVLAEHVAETARTSLQLAMRRSDLTLLIDIWVRRAATVDSVDDLFD